LWMAPEVLLGERVDEKLDVYAFAMVFWEILTRKEVFAEYTDKVIFTKDIALQGIRPPLDDIHPVIRLILIRCWDRNPDIRPTFEQVLPRLENVLIQIYLPSELCPEAPIFWEKNFKQQARVPINVFVQKLIQNLSSQKPLSVQENEKQNLTALLLQKEKSHEKVVSIERFCNLLTWFGKMKNDRDTIIDRVQELMHCVWFFWYGIF